MRDMQGTAAQKLALFREIESWAVSTVRIARNC